jgi:1,4-alpha-glucan branching enzyme
MTTKLSDKKKTPTLSGMGALVGKSGVGFRVWGAGAEKVEVLGEFDGWKGQPLEHEGDGFWYGYVEGAKAGQEYMFGLTTGKTEVTRIDPYARLLTHSAGTGSSTTATPSTGRTTSGSRSTGSGR